MLRTYARHADNLYDGLGTSEEAIDDRYEFKPAPSSSSLANTCLTSRRIKAVAEPILYSNFCHHELWIYTGPKYFEKLASFVWSLHQRPGLGDMVRTVRIRDHIAKDRVVGEWPGLYPDKCHGYPMEHDGFLLAPQRCTDNLQDLAFQLRQTAITAINDDWVDSAVPMRRSAILIQLLLLKAPKEHTSSMEANDSAFPMLKSLAINHVLEDDFNWGLRLSDKPVQLSPELYIVTANRAIEELSFDHCILIDRLLTFAKLKSVSLGRSHLGYGDIKNLLDPCDGLITFSCIAAPSSFDNTCLFSSDPEGFIYEFDAQPQANPRELQQALMRHKDTLEDVIRINQTVLPHYTDDRGGTFLSWKSFTHLKRLTLHRNGLIHPANPSGPAACSFSFFLPDGIEEFDIHRVFNADFLCFGSNITSGRFHRLQKATFGHTDDLERIPTNTITATSLVDLGIEQVLQLTTLLLKPLRRSSFFEGPPSGL